MNIEVIIAVVGIVPRTNHIAHLNTMCTVDQEKLDPKHPIDNLILKRLKNLSDINRATGPTPEFKVADPLNFANCLPSAGSIVPLAVPDDVANKLDDRMRFEFEKQGPISVRPKPTAIILCFMDKDVFTKEEVPTVESLLEESNAAPPNNSTEPQPSAV